MTAVAPPPNFQGLSRTAWGSANGAPNGIHSMSADDVSRMLQQPRKTAQRSNSSSSLSSVSSNSSTISASSTNSAASAAAKGDAASRKRPSRYLWPMSKSEPTAGITTARPQSVASASSGPSAASAISALHAPTPPLGSTTNGTFTQQNGAVRGPYPGENTPVLYLTPMNGTFERKTITVPFYPDVIRIGRQTNAKTVPTPLNGYFDSKVLSRAHAEVWADRNGKIWIRDIKSSNGTFVNGQRLSLENKDSDPHELRETDMLELGIDIVSEDQKTVVHHKVAARVEHAGFLGSNGLLDLGFGDLDPSNPGLMSMGQGIGNHMRRNSGQSAFGNGVRGPGAMGATMNNVAQQRPQHVWLAPINMEQVIKRLSAEYKAAKQQQFDLQRSTQFLDTLLSSEQPQRKDSSTGIPLDGLRSKSANKDQALKTRFSEPPNPPPQAPLPDKPFDIGANAFLRRSDTERPKISEAALNALSGVKLDQSAASQIESLSEALTVAKKEFESQSRRLREMEELLVQERVKRENAEEKAKRLEKEQRGDVETSGSGPIKIKVPNGAPGLEIDDDEEKSSTPIEDEANSEIGRKPEDRDTVAKKLQQRLDQLLSEFHEVKVAAEKWKVEKEKAEKERDEERQEKVSLMEMVEAIRKEQRDQTSKKENKKRDSKVDDGNAGAERDTEVSSSSDPVQPRGRDVSKSFSPLGKNLFPNGHIASSLVQSGKDGTFSNQHGQLVQAAPYISAMSVVLIGVAVMALVNKMSRGER